MAVHDSESTPMSWHVAPWHMHDIILGILGMSPDRAHAAVCGELSPMVKQVREILADESMQSRVDRGNLTESKDMSLQNFLLDANALTSETTVPDPQTAQTTASLNLLKAFPMLNARNYYHFLCNRHTAGSRIANIDFALISVAYLYRAVRSFGGADELYWEDMELAIKDQNDIRGRGDNLRKSSFVPEMNDLKSLTHCFSIALGVKASAIDRRNLKKPRLPKMRGVKGLSDFPVQETSSFMRAQKDTILNESRDTTQGYASNNSPLYRIAKQREGTQGKADNRLRTPVELCRTLKESLMEDDLRLKFDYIGLWSMCEYFVHAIKAEFRTELQLLERDHPENMDLSTTVHEILWQAAYPSKTSAVKPLLQKITPLMSALIKDVGAKSLSAVQPQCSAHIKEDARSGRDWVRGPTAERQGLSPAWDLLRRGDPRRSRGTSMSAPS